MVFTTAYRPFVGGSELALENIIRRLPNIFFDIVTPRHQRGLKKFEQSANVSLWRLGLGWRYDKYFFPALGFLKARRLMKKRSYLAAHAYQASQGAGAAWLLKLFSPGVRFILTLQEGEQLEKQNPAIKFFRRLILKKADIITGISSYLVDYARLINRKAKALVIPNGVDLKKSKAKNQKSKVKIEPSLREKLGFKEDNRVIITVSRLVPKNGVADLIEAVALVKPHLPEIKLMVVGQGPLQESLASRTQKLGLAKEVLFLNGVAPESVYDFLKIADIFVRPSYSEGLGSAFLEAMASGVVPVATTLVSAFMNM